MKTKISTKISAQKMLGKKIWLIGATHGIGEALTHLLVAQGAYIGASGRSIEQLNAMSSAQIFPLPCDVSDFASIKSAYDAYIEHFGKPDFIIYNAGFYEPMNSFSFDLVQVERMVDVNLMGAIRVANIALPEMQHGTFALVGSVAGYRGLPNAFGYGLSKAGIIHMAENIRQDLGKRDVRVQIINPGFVQTRLTAKNNFKMPFCITSEAAAKHILRGLERGNYETHFPKAFTLPLKLISALPSRLYFWISAKIL